MLNSQPISPNKLPWQRALVTLSTVITGAAVLGLITWAQDVFIPLAMAVFFSFILNPIVVQLERRRLNRTAAVGVVVAAAAVLFLGTAAVITHQVASLSTTIADNSKRLVKKIENVKASFAGQEDSQFAKMVRQVQDAISGPAPEVKSSEKAADVQKTAAGAAKGATEGAKAAGADPDADKVTKAAAEAAAQAAAQAASQNAAPAWSSRLNVVVKPATAAFGMAAFSFVLVVFILLAKEDLRDRVMRLIGDGQMTTATRAADEASERISHYLLMQFVVNAAFGLIVSLGLFLAGIEYSLLWGFIGFIMRYIPYIGSWLGLIPPLLFTAAVHDGWGLPIFVVALMGGLELFSNNAVEPRLYGKSLGVSEVALLLSAAFWSFLWGPIGLILSGPITTCLLVVGKYSPSLNFFHVILGTEPPLSPGMLLYQRFISGNEDDATKILETAIKTEPGLKHFDEAFLPALAAVRQAKEAGDLEVDTEARVLKTARAALDNNFDELAPPAAPAAAPTGRVRLLACAARDALDELTVQVLARTLPAEKWEVKVVAASALSSEIADAVTAFDPHVVVIGSLPPGGVAHTRYTSKRLRSRFPNLKILIGRWTDSPEGQAEELAKSGADAVDTTLEAAHNELTGWQSVVLAGVVTPAAVSTTAAAPDPRSAVQGALKAAAKVGTPNA